MKHLEFQSPPEGLQKHLREIISSFSKWKNIADDLTVLFRNFDHSFIMQPLGGNIVLFNSNLLNFVSIDFYTMVMVHEFIHLSVHNIPSKSYVNRIKTIPGQMTELDIEADILTVAFLKEHLNWEVERYFSEYFNGISTFHTHFTQNKYDRFLSSILSCYRTLSAIENPKISIKSHFHAGDQTYIAVISSNSLTTTIKDLKIPRYINSIFTNAYYGFTPNNKELDAVLNSLSKINRQLNY